jgi:DNA-binding PadR family transcriptional regulator
MHILSRSEEIVLLAVLNLGDKAYGVSIRKRILETTGYEWSVGAVYAPLHRLIKKGYVRSTKGAPVAERGGRSKVFYSVTSEGIRALLQIKKVSTQIWKSISVPKLKEP